MPEGDPTPTPDEGGKTFTQEQLNDLLAKQKGEIQRKYADYDELKTRIATLESEKQKTEDDSKSESQKLADQLAALQKQLDEEKTAREKSDRAALRARIGSEAKLPAELIELLQGDDEDALKAHAETLAGLVSGTKDNKPDTKGGRPKETLRPGASNEDDDTEISQAEANKIAETIASRNSI